MDAGHRAAEDLLDRLTAEMDSVYSQALREMEAKQEEFMREYSEQLEAKKRDLEAGRIGREQFEAWQRRQPIGAEWHEQMVRTLAEDLTSADRKALAASGEYVRDAYAINHDFGTFQVESGSLVDTSYTLYDRATVERLIAERPGLLPDPGVDVRKDRRWNQRHLTSAVTQSILQGESIPQAAERLRQVVGMGRNSAVRAARTAITGAENAGRIDSYRRAKALGIGMRKEWLATLDRRTRDTHARLDGERVEVEGRFSNGLRYPGDPSGDPGEVYNCRCTLVPALDGIDQSGAPRDSRLGDMSYEEWRGERERRAAAGESPTLLPHVAQVLGQDYVDAMDTLLSFTEEQDAPDLFRRRGGLVRVADAHEVGGAYFSHADGGVHMNAARVAEGDPGKHPLHAPYQTAFHEFAHAIDFHMAKDSVSVSGSWRSADGLSLRGVLERDWIEYKNGWVRRALDEADEDAFEALVDFSPRLMVREVMSADLERHGAGRWSDVADRLLGVSRDEIIRDPEFQEYVRDVYLAVPPSYLVRNEGVIFYMKRDLAGDVGRGATVSDALEGVAHVDYPLGSGHGREYHDDVPWHTAMEFFAEVVDSKVCNPAALEYAREVFPNGVAAVEEMIGGMLDD